MPLFPTFMAYSVAGWTASETGRSVEDAVLTPIGISFIAASTLTSASSLPLFYAVVLFLSYLLLGFTTTVRDVSVNLVLHRKRLTLPKIKV